MKNITKIAGKAGARLCDRSRSVKLRVLDIARAARAKGKPHQQRLKRAYGQLLNSTSRVVGQAKRFSKEIAEGVKRSRKVLQQLALDGLRREIDTMVPLVRQVMKQTRARIFRGETRFEGKLFSLFEPSTEIIRKSLPRRRPGARRPSPTSSARWSSCRKPKIRSSSITRSTLADPTILICSLRRLKRIKQCWVARRISWQPTPHFTQ